MSPFFRAGSNTSRPSALPSQLPLLRKDFLLERYQLLEARAAGADAVLLIAEILDDTSLPHLLSEAAALGLHALVELYDPANLPRVLDRRRPHHWRQQPRSAHLRRRAWNTPWNWRQSLPPGCVLVSESGIRNRGDILSLEAAGVHAVLIGETFMRAADIAREGAGIDARLMSVGGGTIPA